MRFFPVFRQKMYGRSSLALPALLRKARKIMSSAFLRHASSVCNFCQCHKEAAQPNLKKASGGHLHYPASKVVRRPPRVVEFHLAVSPRHPTMNPKRNRWRFTRQSPNERPATTCPTGGNLASNRAGGGFANRAGRSRGSRGYNGPSAGQPRRLEYATTRWGWRFPRRRRSWWWSAQVNGRGLIIGGALL